MIEFSNGSVVLWKNQPIAATRYEYRLLELLVEARGQAVSYEQIHRLRYKPKFLMGHGLDGYRTNIRSLVKRLRVKFTKLDPEFHHIKNVAKVGYRWDITASEVEIMRRKRVRDVLAIAVLAFDTDLDELTEMVVAAYRGDEVRFLTNGVFIPSAPFKPKEKNHA